MKAKVSISQRYEVSESLDLSTMFFEDRSFRPSKLRMLSSQVVTKSGTIGSFANLIISMLVCFSQRYDNILRCGLPFSLIGYFDLLKIAFMNAKHSSHSDRWSCEVKT